MNRFSVAISLILKKMQLPYFFIHLRHMRIGTATARVRGWGAKRARAYCVLLLLPLLAQPFFLGDASCVTSAIG
jgi:hypothetical protein